MKILLAIDGSPHSQRAVDTVAGWLWPKDAVFEILTVVHPTVPILPDPAFVIAGIHEEQSLEQWHAAPELLERASREIVHRAEVTVETKALEGSPKRVIVEEARTWGADLIVVGSHGYGRLARLTLGSVAGAVVADAPCSVVVVRSKEATAGENSAAWSSSLSRQFASEHTSPLTLMTTRSGKPMGSAETTATKRAEPRQGWAVQRKQAGTRFQIDCVPFILKS